MRVKELKAILADLSDTAEVIVHSDSDSRDYEVINYRIVELGSRYFGGPKPESDAVANCLVLDTF